MRATREKTDGISGQTRMFIDKVKPTFFFFSFALKFGLNWTVLHVIRGLFNNLHVKPCKPGPGMS